MDGWEVNMKNFTNRTKTIHKKRKIGHRTTVITLIALLMLGTIGVVFAANFGEGAGGIVEKAAEMFTVSDGDENKEKTIEEEKRKAGKAEKEVIQRGGIPEALSGADIKKQVEAEIEEAVNSVVLSEGFETNISERSDSARISHNVKTVIADKSLNESQQERFEAYITANTDITVVCALFDFMFDNFFTEADMDQAIGRFNGGEELNRILDNYANADEGYIAHSYPEGMLEYLLDKKGVSIEELYVAETISHRGLTELNTVIGRLSNNETMADICAELGILNINCRMVAVTVSSSEVTECIEQLGISEDEAIKKITEAKKAKVPDKDIINYIEKGGKPKGETLNEYYLEKFDGGTTR
jgi:hypothetical protein